MHSYISYFWVFLCKEATEGPISLFVSPHY